MYTSDAEKAAYTRAKSLALSEYSKFIDNWIDVEEVRIPGGTGASGDSQAFRIVNRKTREVFARVSPHQVDAEIKRIYNRVSVTQLEIQAANHKFNASFDAQLEESRRRQEERQKASLEEKLNEERRQRDRKEGARRKEDERDVKLRTQNLVELRNCGIILSAPALVGAFIPASPFVFSASGGFGAVDVMLAAGEGDYFSAAFHLAGVAYAAKLAAAARIAPATIPQVQAYLNGSGGRLGGTATRQLNHRLATDLENRGFTVTNGAGRNSEQWIRGPGGGTTGGTWVDITARNGNQWVRIQTVDTLADGVTLTAREAAAAARIRAAFPNDQLILVSKQTGLVIP